MWTTIRPSVKVDVIVLPEDPALYARALLSYPYFEATTYTAEDARRTEQYAARRHAATLASSAVDLDSFLRDLEMRAVVAPFDELHLPRIVQLFGKTNQFNLTTRRHTLADVQAFMESQDWVHFYLKLSDRFADHGLVGIALAHKQETTLEIESFLMSCRVIGRTVERTMLARLAAEARRLGCDRLLGIYLPTAKNGVVKDMYASQGFELVSEQDGGATWSFDLSGSDIANEFIVVEELSA
jgi:FkbH-like protein